MRHLFLVQSPVTDLVARGVAAFEGLAPERTLRLVVRGLAGTATRADPAGGPTGVLEPVRLGRGLDVLERRRRLRAFDRRVDRLTAGERFHAYVPQTRLRWIQALLSHSGCSGFSFVEEGLASYRTRPEVAAMYPADALGLLGWLCYGRRVGRGEFFAPGHARAYGLTEASFPDLPRRVVVPWPAPCGEPPSAFQDRPLGTVLVFDGLSRSGTVRIESVLCAVGRALDVLAERGVERVHYKLHPAQLGSDEVERVAAALARRERPRVERLPDDLVLEELAAARRDVRLLVNLSSAGLYAALLGRTVESYAPFVVDEEPAFAVHVRALPRVFRERVRFLGADP